MDDKENMNLEKKTNPPTISNGVKNWGIFFGVIIAAALAVSGVAYLAAQNSDSHGSDTHKEQKHGEGDSQYSIDQVPLLSIEDLMPSLDREVQFSSSIPEEARIIMQNNTGEIIGRLKDDPTRGDDWLDLGLLYHAASDYRGAEEIWEFLALVDPTNVVPVENLAKLYHFNIPNYPKSESLFRRAITLDPDSFSPYNGLYELYRYSYKTNTTAAPDILRQALLKFPEEIRIYLMLGQYYRDLGNTTLARQALLEGLDEARNTGDVELIAAFGLELERVQ